MNSYISIAADYSDIDKVQEIYGILKLNSLILNNDIQGGAVVLPRSLANYKDMEGPDVYPNLRTMRELLILYTNEGDIDGAEKVLKETRDLGLIPQSSIRDVSIHTTDGTSDLSLSEWAEIYAGGLTVDKVYGMHGPNDRSKVGEVYGKAFDRFKPLVDIGSRRFVGHIRNSAVNKVDLVTHAHIGQHKFIEFLNQFTTNLSEEISHSSGPNNRHLIKAGEGFDHKNKYKNVSKITDMIRSTVICHSISSLHSTVLKFIEYCSDNEIQDLNIVNFYDNIAKFGYIDQADETCLFGYVGIHITIPLEIFVPTDESSSSLDCGFRYNNEFTIMAEIQFHPSTFYDGTDTCLKEKQHAVYRAFNTGEVHNDVALAVHARSAVMMHYAYAMAITPK
mmetsp:Transcript_853/g.959  ORF Transcript_853/g.959 Transcript_853/m.959 type:complete len:392 (-) Transcript_853:149-1324(-)